jgi:hypothetical protein
LHLELVEVHSFEIEFLESKDAVQRGVEAVLMHPELLDLSLVSALERALWEDLKAGVCSISFLFTERALAAPVLFVPPEAVPVFEPIPHVREDFPSMCFCDAPCALFASYHSLA